jgi:hypothetical protein
MEPRHRLTRALVLVVLAAAVLTGPVFLLAEELDREHVLRVLASNGVSALLCVGLLALLRRGRAELAARLLVFGLLALVGALAWTNGEGVHVNVVNFVLVTVLAAALLDDAGLLLVAASAACLMVAIAWKQASPAGGEELTEARVESILQFLPTYAVIVLVLWLQRRASRRGAARAPERPPAP